MDILILVDLQNDFISGSLGTKEAQNIIPDLINYINDFKGMIFLTRDTHGNDYLSTLEGRNLPIIHCIHGDFGWNINNSIMNAVLRTNNPFKIINKNSFGSIELMEELQSVDYIKGINNITFAGLCTDICIVTNVLLAKTFFPETQINVIEKCCAGVTISSHQAAINTMKSTQITMI